MRRPASITLASVAAPLPPHEDGRRDVYLPLGCMYLVAALERAGVAVEFRDYQLYAAGAPDPLDPELLLAFLEDAAPVLGVSCMVSMLPFVLTGLERYKQRHPDRTVVLGGPGPSGVDEAIVRQMPWIDVVCRGEGEETIVELMAALADGGDLRPVRGVTFRDGGAIRRNPPRPRIRDLDALPLPAYGRADLSAYTTVPVVTGRGCPFRCAFCDVGPLWENRTVVRGVAGVIEELRILRDEHGIRSVNIADDTFDLSRRRTEAFCDAVAPLRMKWSCLARIDLMDADLLERMTGAGCDAVFLGIESGSNEVLRRINKRFTIEEALAKAELAAGRVPQVITSFIWGFPFESLGNLKSTLVAILAMWRLGARAGLKLLSPMPLSNLGIEYRDRLAFAEDLCSVFASLGNTAAGRGAARAAIPEPLQAAIRAHPDVYAAFYHIADEGLREKAEYLRRFSERRGIRL